MLRLCVSAAFIWAVATPASHAAGVRELRGEGVQIYRCAAQEAGFAWKLKAPEATLTDASGRVMGRHFAGPSWQATDGSVVVGKAVAAGSVAGGGAVPWLVVQAVSHAGAGVFADVSYVVRTQTTGGVAPAAGCGAGHAGAEARVRYSASYIFFGAK